LNLFERNVRDHWKLFDSKIRRQFSEPLNPPLSGP
jgi:hypothetical protein